MPVSSSVPPSAVSRPQAVRHFGRFQLLQLVGKSERTMLWLVADPRNGQDLVLAMPRNRPADALALDRWMQSARRASRIDHPSLAHAVEVGEVEQWPYVTYDRGNSASLSELLTTKGMVAAELVPRALQALQGLAFAHEAGAAHQDLQPTMLLIGESGPCRVLGVGVALGSEDPGPMGRDIVRLPWSTAQQIPEALRAIVNRATDRQERQRYRNARTLQHALEGWLSTQAGVGGGPVVQLLDRVRANGVLPAVPGGAARAARLALMERERTSELAEIVLQDTALAFELLRMVNSAQVRAAMAAGGGPVMTIRRSIAMLGLDGVRRAALSLRAWPGPLNDAHAVELERLLDRARHAARIAQWLRPRGYDAEVVFLITLLQNLGRLVLQYHFPEEAQQMRRLMQPAPAAKAGEPDEPGMTEEGAAFAVLGTDVESLGSAVTRQWGLDESMLHMIRRVSPGTPIRSADSDDDVLRLSASCANEVVDVASLPPSQQSSALQRIAQRYARALGVTLRDIQLASQGIAPGSEDEPAGRVSQLGGLN
jgi:HD-like signal output (HDOD) protein